MDATHIKTKFEKLGARAKIGQLRRLSATPLVIDIGHDRHGEFFDLQAADDADVEVLDVQPRDRHLLLMVRRPNQRPGLPDIKDNSRLPPMLTVLWDNDGVLVDTEGLYFRATQEVLRTVGICLTSGQFKEISLRRGESTFVLAAEHGITDQETVRLRADRDQRYAELLRSQSWAIDGAEEVLRILHGQVRMGVVTSARKVHFETAHASTGLRQYLDFVLTREDYKHTKPHPEPYLTAMARHDLRPEDCIVVEDSERGLAAATAAGLPCLIVMSDWSRDANFSGAAKVLENIRHVPGVALTWADGKRDVGSRDS